MQYLTDTGLSKEARDELARLEVPPDDVKLLLTRGELSLRLHQQQQADDHEFLKRAADDYFRIVQLEPEVGLHWLKAASLLVAAGDAERYRQLCQDALTRFAEAKTPNVAEQMVKICSILPQDDPLRTRAAQFAVEKLKNGRQTPRDASTNN